MRARFHRHPRVPPDLNITAFLNLMVALVPFLLITAVFSHISILELNIPPAVESADDPSKALQLEIVIRKDTLEVADRRGGLIRRIDNENGRHNFKLLGEVLQQLKARFPDKLDATLLAEDNTPYEVLIQAMDATRSIAVLQAGEVIQAELFPEISIGDAPRPAEPRP